MKIGVYCNAHKDPDGKACDEIFSVAKAKGITAERFNEADEYDLVVSIGGDGTILRVAKSCAVTGAPILGVNKGTVGFLTETEPDGFSEALDNFLSRQYILERRALLDTEVHGKHYYALNDAVVMRNSGGRMINMDIKVSDALIDSFACDGYIACTPTGSTAYSLSAGGSVIAPNTPVIALTPINPHTLRTRPVVVGSFEKITMVYKGSASGDNHASLYIDGEEQEALDPGDAVTVTGWDRSAMFVRFGSKSFYSRLLGKLNSWSAGE